MRYTVWKNEKFSLTEKIFRQINSLVTSLVKSLLSRNFCQKSVRENFRNFHTVPSRLVWIFRECEFTDLSLVVTFTRAVKVFSRENKLKTKLFFDYLQTTYIWTLAGLIMINACIWMMWCLVIIFHRFCHFLAYCTVQCGKARNSLFSKFFFVKSTM